MNTNINKKTVVLATHNIGKVAEMQQPLLELGLDIVAQSELHIESAIEDGLSFVENAIIKARHACHHSQLPSIADDSGLEVDALHGAPGVYSARYSDSSDDQSNNVKLLNELKNNTLRSARFHSVIVYMQHDKDPTPIICHGTWDGEIAQYPSGENGFGYDPIFYLPDYNCTAAELEPARKKRISHRAKALENLHIALQRHVHQA